MLFALFVSIPLGVIAALRRNTWIDYLCTGYTVLGFAVPNFGLALILIYVFSIKFDWLPITGIGSAEAATANVSYSCLASSGLTALAKAYRN